MLYIKKAKIEEPVVTMEDFEEAGSSTWYDVRECAFDIELECARFEFENTHLLLEAYQATLEEDETTDAEFKEVDDGKDSSAKQSVESNKGFIEKVRGWIKKIWEKIKALTGKFINWITNKLGSNEKFISRFKNVKLGKIKKELPDFDASFKRINESDTLAKGLYKIASNMHEYAKDFVAQGDFDQNFVNAIANLISNRRLSTDTKVDGVIKEILDGQIVDKKEREVDGSQLLAIFERNKDISKSITNITKEYSKVLSSIDSKMNKYFGDIGFLQANANTIKYDKVMVKTLATISARVSTGTIKNAQILITGIRSAITACANNSEAV